MVQGNGIVVDVEFVVIDFQLMFYCYDLCVLCFVDFEVVDVGYCQVIVFEQGVDGWYWVDVHDFWWYIGYSGCDDVCQWLFVMVVYVIV